jgi:ankyrin repeat protein
VDLSLVANFTPLCIINLKLLSRKSMDAKFHPAMAAIKDGNIDELKAILRQDPSLATARSSRSHPTLLQCLALDAVDVPNKVEMAQVLIAAGADLDEPLVAAGSIGNVEVAAALLDAGAAIDRPDGWSPLEEALYWGNDRVVALLLERGASVSNLRSAAGLGRMDLLKSFFDTDGKLKPEAGKMNWPFGGPETCNHQGKIGEELRAKIAQWSHEPGEIINNAFIYACMHNQIEAAKFLLEKGADINAIPTGFDYAGTGLHYAALNGHRGMVDFLLERGADPTIKDTKVGSMASGWAEHGGHPELGDYLKKKTTDFAAESGKEI